MSTMKNAISCIFRQRSTHRVTRKLKNMQSESQYFQDLLLVIFCIYVQQRSLVYQRRLLSLLPHLSTKLMGLWVAALACAALAEPLQ